LIFHTQQLSNEHFFGCNEPKITTQLGFMLCLQDQIYFVYKTATLCLNLINLY